MNRVVLRFLVAVGLLLVVAGMFVAFTLRASLPDLDGEIVVAGLVDSASIERDADGIPVITASSRADLAFATGFAHGQDRFFQMDTIRRQAAGELSELVGTIGIKKDKLSRFHRFRSRARNVIANAADGDRAILAAYTDGVNAGLNSLGARPFEYIALGAEPQRWLPEDSILVVFAMYMQLNDARASKDVQRGWRTGCYRDRSTSGCIRKAPPGTPR